MAKAGLEKAPQLNKWCHEKLDGKNAWDIGNQGCCQAPASSQIHCMRYRQSPAVFLATSRSKKVQQASEIVCLQLFNNKLYLCTASLEISAGSLLSLVQPWEKAAVT